METSKLLGAGAYLTGLAITLFLAAYLTPRDWWRRPNLRALTISVLGAWGFGSLLLWCLPRPAPASPAAANVSQANVAGAVAPPDAAPVGMIAGQPFRVHRDLNLRTEPGVQAARLLTVPSGATVTPTGVRRGDWWQVTARVAGHDSTGWASSLWLRRGGE